jgi:hypothetical protein
MASIEKRTSRDGRSTTWRVRWRTGGAREGAWDSETCDELKIARRFKASVEAAGERRPQGYPKGCRGLKLGAATESDPEPAEPQPYLDPAACARRAGRTFGRVVEEYLGQLKRPERRQIADYRRLWRQHVEPAIVTLTDGRRVQGLIRQHHATAAIHVAEAYLSWLSGDADIDPIRPGVRRDREEVLIVAGLWPLMKINRVRCASVVRPSDGVADVVDHDLAGEAEAAGLGRDDVVSAASWLAALLPRH